MRSVDAFIALNRFGLGAGPGGDAPLGGDPRGWLGAQLAAGVPPAPPGRSADDLLTEVARARLQGQGDAALRTAMERDFRPALLARGAQLVQSEAPLVERLVLFWSNHFTVSTTRWAIAPMTPAFEAEAIRPQVLGRFADMLRAAVRHPVMLTYLDNPRSVGPDSVEGRARGGGVNENLAREVLELHTLGAQGGYGQADVSQFALALTGWSHGGLPHEGAEAVHGRFRFVQAHHQPGPKVVLGRLYDEAGEGEGLAILDDLARHPATARHLATKLVRHFVADDPPARAVARIARVFQDSEGDLAEVARALVELPEAWSDPLAKVKTPHELVLAVHRVLGGEAPQPGDYLRPLRLLGMMPFSAPGPQGWGDRARDWLTPEALMTRIAWLRGLTSARPEQAPRAVMEATIGAVLHDATRTWVYRAPSPRAGLAMVLASAEFQRR